MIYVINVINAIYVILIFKFMININVNYAINLAINNIYNV